MNPDLACIANSLAGNCENEAVIEFFLSGPSFRLERGRCAWPLLVISTLN